jgi:hypothetical protein
MHELFSLLMFAAPSVFEEAMADAFAEKFVDVGKNEHHFQVLSKVCPTIFVQPSCPLCSLCPFTFPYAPLPLMIPFHEDVLNPFPVS